jgi:hypothetical protein
MSKACVTYGKKRTAYRILVCNRDETKPLERPRRIWEDNIKIDVNEMGWEGVDSINLALSRYK